MQRGTKDHWFSGVMRVHVSSLVDRNKWPERPQGLVGLCARARSAFPVPSRLPGKGLRAPLTINASADLERLDKLDFLSRSEFKASHLPASTVSIRRDVQDGQVLRLSGHLNQPFGDANGWRQVRHLNSCVSITYSRSRVPRCYCTIDSHRFRVICRCRLCATPIGATAFPHRHSSSESVWRMSRRRRTRTGRSADCRTTSRSTVPAP
jgi:hypothetical protein